MANIKFEIADPYLENRKFGICIDKIDYEKEKFDSKSICMDKIFCLFKLPELGVPRIENLMTSQNVRAMEWLKLYANSLKEKYEREWETQPGEMILTVGLIGLPTLEELRSLGTSKIEK